MQRVTLVRYTTKPDSTDENEQLSRAVFDEVRRNQPKHIAYAVFRDGDEFVHLFVNLAEDSSDAVTGLASFDRYQEKIRERSVAPPEPIRVVTQLVDSYGFATA
jgi:hypothetical protein